MNPNHTPDMVNEFFQILKQLPRVKYWHTPGLTRSEQELLAVVAIHADKDKKTLTATSISNLLQITPAGVTHLINPLEEAGFLERLPDPHDRRVVRIGLTEKGAREAEAFLGDVREKMTELIGLLGEEDSRTFLLLLSRVIKHFSNSGES